MKKALTFIAVAGVLALAMPAVPARAAVIDQVKNKVDAIKNETAAIKSKVNDLQVKVNGQIREIAELQEALDKLKLMKTKLGGAGIDPAEVLEMIPLDELRAAMDEARQNREAFQQQLNDPGLESFRVELLETLKGVNRAITGDAAPEATPLQTLIEKAPKPLIAVLKAASETAFAPLKDSVTSAVESMNELQSLGLLTVASGSADEGGSAYVAVAYPTPAGVSGSAALTWICQAIENHGVNAVHSGLWKYQDALLKLKHNQSLLNEKAARQLARLPKLPDIGVHGYLTLRLSGVDVAWNFEKLTGTQEKRLEYVVDRTDHWLRKVEWIGGEAGVNPCDLASASSPRSSSARPARTRSGPTGTSP